MSADDAPSPSERTAEPTLPGASLGAGVGAAPVGGVKGGPPPRSSRWPVVLLVLLVVLVGLPGLVLTAASFRATDLERLNAEYAPFHQVPEVAKAPREACGLNQVKVTACEAARATSRVTQEVRFPSSIADKGLAELSGTLTLPQGVEGLRPAVVLIHGSGPFTRQLEIGGDLVRKLPQPFALFDELTSWLSDQGFVVLAYDKRSCIRCYGSSSFDPQRFSFDDFETDARDALRYLAKRPEVNRRALVVLGVSKGGGTAVFVAKDEPGVVAAVSLSGLLEGFGKALTEQLTRIAEVRKGQLDYFASMNVYVQQKQYGKCLAQLEGDAYQPDAQCLGGGVTQRALKEFDAKSQRTVDALLALPVPAFLSQGTLDRNVSPELFMGLRERAAGRDVELHFIRGMDHSQTDAFAAQNQLHPELLTRLAAFFARVPTPPAPLGLLQSPHEPAPAEPAPAVSAPAASAPDAPAPAPDAPAP
ncbi:MAG: alpha/beta hydrolase [Polyangiaceae bacterium]|nr:alpha/beta hydrolase [Polyangiaceae bacterium]